MVPPAQAAPSLLSTALWSWFIRLKGELLRYVRGRIPYDVQAWVHSEDILQEVRIEALRQSEQAGLVFPRDFARWAKRIARGKVSDATRSAPRRKRGGRSNGPSSSRRRPATSAAGLARAVCGRPAPPAEAILQEELTALEVALTHLSEAEAAAIRLHELAGLSCKDVAKRMDRSLAGVHDLLFRGRANLRRELCV